LRKRKPKTEGIFYFKKTKKYQALGYFASKDTFIVVGSIRSSITTALLPGK